MTGEPQRHNFWTTLPGILTGVAAMVTAVTGLMIGLSQQRGPDEQDVQQERTAQRERAGAVAPNAPAGAAANAPAEASKAPAGTPKKEAMAVITAEDGSVTSVYAGSLRHYQTGRELPLLSGQSIPFDRIRTIEVTRLESGQALVDVTLVNGTVHSGAIAAGLSPYGFGGMNDLGSFDIRVDKLARITFER
jgi:hypothetical protein